jgi:PAS domain S-box-containing protein
VNNLSASFPDAGSEQFRAELVQIASGATHFEMEMVGQTLRGRKLSVNLNWAVIPGCESDLSKTIVSIMDITERKQGEGQLRQLSRAVEHSPASIDITDIDGNIEYVNPKFSEVTGYAPDEARGKNPRILKSGQTPTDIYSHLWQTILSGKEWRGEFLNRKKDGEFFWEYASISAITDPKGSISHFVAVKEDITERKAAEEKIRLLNVELEQLALTDELTGINNHRAILQFAEREFNVAMRYRQPFSMMFFDLDYFKQINDTFGHALGDQALKQAIQAVCI